MERVLEHARRFSPEVEVMVVEGTSTPVGFEADRLKEIQTRESWGLGIRLVIDGQVGLSSTNDPNDVEDVVQRAVELARYGPEAAFRLPRPAAYPSVPTNDPSVARVTIEEMVDAGRAMVAAAKEADPDVQFDGGLHTGQTTFHLMNSHGVKASYEKSSFGVSLSGTLIRGTDMLFVGDRVRSCSPRWEMERLQREVRRQLEWARILAPAPAGKVPVLFTPKAVAGVLLGPFLAAINGRTVLQGSSPLGNRVGEQVFDARLSIWDEPTLPLKPASRPWDDEGVPSRPQPLVEKGIFRTILHDLQTAGQAHTTTTASASRGLGSMPSPASSYLRIEPGDATFESMLQEMQDGVIVEQLIGAGQGNVLGGDAGGNILLGYRVQGGKVTGRVKDTMLHCNIYDVLREVGALGSETEEVGGFLSTPAILCRGVSIAPKGS